MVDLKQQYLNIKPAIDAAIHEVLDNTNFINGKPVQTFAEELSKYLHVKHTIPCANGTDALQIAMMALGLQPGDEIITPSFTYIATTEVIALLKLKPIFVEVDPQTFCIDPQAIEKAITPKTKAIVPVHLYGQSANMEAIMRIAKQHNLFVIEDNAQAIGCDYTFSNGVIQKTGTIGHIGCTSFFPSKNLGCYGDGGAICTNDDSLAATLKMIANHGQSVKYYHDVVGCNSRLDTIQAAVLNIKLKKLEEYIKARQQAAAFYNKAFAPYTSIITTPYIASYSTHVYHQYTIQLKGINRNALHDYLAAQNIPSMIYYPVPAHQQKMFTSYNTNYLLPITNQLTTCVLSLPMHTELDEEQLQYITNHIINYVKNN
ncbi:MAG TPA: DegT/DnrJ/EryC1/StrS family aminotransferase [Chitinophagaceae bacterium]|nr:DegT/DnrJ/EryC1/StrS family aminotransferase [Chitinophagaceae bacterium]